MPRRLSRCGTRRGNPRGRERNGGECEEHARANPGGKQRRRAAALHMPRERNARRLISGCLDDGLCFARAARRIANITPSSFAGHSMLPPRHAKAARWGPRCCAPTRQKRKPKRQSGDWRSQERQKRRQEAGATGTSPDQRIIGSRAGRLLCRLWDLPAGSGRLFRSGRADR